MNDSRVSNSKLIKVVALSWAAVCFWAAVAQSDQASAPTAASLIEALKAKGPSRGLMPAGDSELIKALKEKTSRGIAITAEERDRLAEATKSLPAFDMDIPFDLNSADITDRARPNIEALGKALQDNQLKGGSFLLAGHTDVSGTLPFNQALSERRAAAVRAVLIKQFHLTNEQLIAVGYGPQHLKNPKQPDAPENRRVRIVNLGE